ncbi:hypothetical protein RND71_035552 [Anisodus tanguticus]|uniref:Suppressor of forked domain-containing protein n=1 Tax=Anisodus tanguticus TaxID=243964 RepID=A0AAE1R551_9SOLA|nr:hypothetical protein RND71_035552 [Anisodus tanguticus]
MLETSTLSREAVSDIMTDKYNVEAAEMLANETLRLAISEAVPIYEQLLSTFPTAVNDHFIMDAEDWGYLKKHMKIKNYIAICSILVPSDEAKYWKQYVEAYMAVNNDDATKQIFSRCLLNCLQIPLCGSFLALTFWCGMGLAPWSFLGCSTLCTVMVWIESNMNDSDGAGKLLWRRCYIRFIRKVNDKRGNEAQEETRKAYDFMLNYVGADIASGPVWMEYIAFLRSLPAQTTQEESQRMTSVRKTYQRAIVTPTHHVEQLWRDYETFENSISRALAKGLVSEYQPKYNSARAVYRERKKYIDEIDWNMLAIPPSGSSKAIPSEEMQWMAWKKLLAFEKHASLSAVQSRRETLNGTFVLQTCFQGQSSKIPPFLGIPLNTRTPNIVLSISAMLESLFLENSFEREILEEVIVQAADVLPKTYPMCPCISFGAPVDQRTIKGSPCLMYLYHYPDIWYEYATTHAKAGSIDSAIKVFQRALKALPDSEMLRYAYAELEESRGAIQAAKKVYESLLGDGSNASALSHIQVSAIITTEDHLAGLISFLAFIRFLRRSEGVEASRKYFVDARKSPSCTYHVYVAYAMMAFCLDKDAKMAHNVFEAGLKRFMHEPGYILEPRCNAWGKTCGNIWYADFLHRLNDDRNIRALFERALSSLPPEESVEVWKKFTQFEQTYGDLASMLKVEQRRKEALSRTGDDGTSELESSLQDVVSRYSFMDLWPCSSNDLDHLARQEWLGRNINKKPDKPTVGIEAGSADKTSSGVSSNTNPPAKVLSPDTSKMTVYDPRQMPGPAPLAVPSASGTLPFSGPFSSSGPPNSLNDILKSLPPAFAAFVANLPAVEGIVLNFFFLSNVPVTYPMKS